MTSTTAHDLPFQVGGDRPCDAPAVWCDFANRLDVQMNANDLLIGRYQPTVSMAKLTRDTDEIFVTSTQAVLPIRFEGVEVDTDDMADFSVSAFSIKPRRAGTYFVAGEVSVASGDVDNFIITVTKGPVVVSGASASYTDAVSETGNRGSYTAPFVVRGSGHFPWNTGDRVGFSLLVNPQDSGTFSIQFATLAVYWVSDVIVSN